MGCCQRMDEAIASDDEERFERVVYRVSIPNTTNDKKWMLEIGPSYDKICVSFTHCPWCGALMPVPKEPEYCCPAFTEAIKRKNITKTKGSHFEHEIVWWIGASANEDTWQYIDNCPFCATRLPDRETDKQGV